MSKHKSRRGRQAGQLAKEHGGCHTLEDHMEVATRGDFEPPVFNAVQNLDFIARIRAQITALHRDSARARWLDASGLPPMPGGLDLMDHSFRKVWDGPYFARVMASRTVHDILDAVERRDAEFFFEIGRRLNGLGEGDTGMSPTSKIRYALTADLQDKENAESANPLVKGFRAQILPFQKSRKTLKSKIGRAHV